MNALDTAQAPASLPTPSRRARISSWTRWLLPPLLAYAAIQVGYLVAAYRQGYGWLQSTSRVRWDSHLYLDIATNGYSVMRCSEAGPNGWDPNAWCGNAAWFPLFPYLTRGLATVTGLEPAAAAVVMAELCALGILIAVWQLLGATITPRNLACLALAALLPAGIYFHAVFPMSLAVLLTLVTFAMLERGRWLLAGLAAAVTATAYPIAVLIAPAAVCYLAAARGTRLPQRLIRAVYVAGLAAAGTLAVFAFLRLTTRRPNAFFMVQEKYGNGLHNPVDTYVAMLGGYHAPLPTPAARVLLDRIPVAISAEMLFSSLLVVVGLVAAGIALARRRATALDAALVVYGPLMLIAPLIVGQNVSQYRSHALLLPVVLLLRHLPAPVIVVVVGLAAPLTYVLAALFLAGLVV
jgi:hypothetical protein